VNADRVAVYTRSEVQLERLNIENGSKRQRIGARGERLARLYLRLHGYRILQRNYRVAHKEIDIIAKKGSTVAFVEVKTALDSKELPPMLRVGSAKRANMAYAAKYFAANYRQKAVYYRFDIIEVILSEHKIRHIENAFMI
jgi:putative endonuclease